MRSFQKKLWIGLVILALLTPIGIILPEKFKAGDAWGEWGTDTLERLVGYVPEGLRKLADTWRAPIPDYNLGGEGSSLAVQAASYVLSALFGVLIVFLIVYLISKFLVKHER